MDRERFAWRAWAVTESREAHVAVEHVPLALAEINMPVIYQSKMLQKLLNQKKKKKKANNWEF